MKRNLLEYFVKKNNKLKMHNNIVLFVSGCINEMNVCCYDIYDFMMTFGAADCYKKKFFKKFNLYINYLTQFVAT